MDRVLYEVKMALKDHWREVLETLLSSALIVLGVAFLVYSHQPEGNFFLKILLAPLAFVSIVFGALGIVS